MTQGARWSIMVLSAIFALFAISKFSQSETKVPPTLRLILFWFQFLAVFPSLSSAWPTVLFNFLNFTSIFNLDLGYLGMECDIGGNSYFTMQTIKVVLPFIFLFFLCGERIALFLLKIAGKPSLLHIIGQTITVTNFLSMQLLSSMFQVFNCVESGDGRYVIKQDPSVTCHSETWKKFVVFDSVMILLYLLLIPLWVAFKFKKAMHDKDKKTLSILIHPLTSFYRPGAEFFEICRLVFRILFVLVRDALPLSSVSKITFYMLLLLALVWFESDVRPYADRAQQGLSIL
jgi:hypothetical protein